jgi:hypothetical protein
MYAKSYIVFLHNNVYLVKTIKDIARHVRDKDLTCQLIRKTT